MATRDAHLTFDKLKLESIVIEMRYPVAYLFWDRAGQVFEEIKRRLPAGRIELTSANPGTVSIVYDGRFDITVETGRFAVGCGGYGLEVKQFLTIASTVYQIVVETVKLEVFERIGLRQVFSKKFPSLRKANEALSQLPAIEMLQKPLGRHKDNVISPSATVRMEDEAKGTTFAIKTGERDFEVGMPAIFWDSIEEDDRKVRLHHSLFIFDIDTYTRSEVSIDQFELTEWVKQQSESVKHDAAMFF